MITIVWVATAIFTCRAQIITGIAKEHARHLWYVSYINDFTVGFVEWQYGEVRIVRQGHETPIFLELTADEWRTEGASSRRNGSMLRGSDPQIGRLGRTRSFQYAPGSSVKFFRLWHAINTSLDSPRPSIEHLTDQGSWADFRWTVTPGMVQDTMDVALWLVDARSGEWLFRLDSVGVIGSSTAAIPRRYGTQPDRALHQVKLPDQYAGIEVAIEPLPYRFGPTPFGLQFVKRFNTFNMSVLFEREADEVFPGPLPRSEDVSFSAKIDSAYGHDLRQYYADAFLEDSCRPALMCLYSMDSQHQDALNSFLASIRFRRDDPDCHRRAAADTAWWMGTLGDNVTHGQNTTITTAHRILSRPVTGTGMPEGTLQIAGINTSVVNPLVETGTDVGPMASPAYSTFPVSRLGLRSIDELLWRSGSGVSSSRSTSTDLPVPDLSTPNGNER